MKLAYAFFKDLLEIFWRTFRSDRHAVGSPDSRRLCSSSFEPATYMTIHVVPKKTFSKFSRNSEKFPEKIMYDI